MHPARTTDPSHGNSTAEKSQDSYSGLKYAWYVVFVLMLCNTLSFVDRQILSLLVSPIKQDLGISDTRIGILQGFAFALFYTVMGLPLGRIADTWSRRNLISIGVLFWSITTTLCSTAKSFWSLFLARMGVGVGEATLAPSAFSLLADYFTSRALATALSVYSMGIFLGSGLALVVGGMVVDATSRMPALNVPLLGQMASWRLTFLVVGGPGLLVALLVRTVREPLRRAALRTAEGHVSKLTVAEVIVQLRLRWQSVVGIAFGMVFQTTCLFGFNAWAPSVFQRVYGWQAGRTGLALGLIIVPFGCLGMYAGGALCDHWKAKGIGEAPLKVAVWSAVGNFIFFLPALMASTTTWTLALLCPALFCLGLPIGSSFSAIQLIFPNQVRAQISALLLFILNLGGLTFGPLLPGLFNDYLFRSEKMVGYSLALAIGLASVAMAITYRLTYNAYRTHLAAMERPSAAIAN
jgi:MFS family permease